MIELVIDLETTGFIKTSVPFSDESQPHIVQIGAIMREDKAIIQTIGMYVNCPIEVPDSALKVHGISQEKTMLLGIDPALATVILVHLMASSDLVIAHNIDFDLNILKVACERYGAKMPEYNALCTMKAWASHFGEKWPKLADAYRKAAPENAASETLKDHDALDDVRKALTIKDYLDSKLAVSS